MGNIIAPIEYGLILVAVSIYGIVVSAYWKVMLMDNHHNNDGVNGKRARI